MAKAKEGLELFPLLEHLTGEMVKKGPRVTEKIVHCVYM